MNDNRELTDDEFTVLSIAVQGESMIPIGRWEKPILDLTERGLMRCGDSVNYFITATGRKAQDAHENAHLRAMIETTGKVTVAQRDIQNVAEHAAGLLAQIAKASTAITGDSPATALRKWVGIVQRRAEELL